jgi:hypothetical protein
MGTRVAGPGIKPEHCISVAHATDQSLQTTTWRSGLVCGTLNATILAAEVTERRGLCMMNSNSWRGNKITYTISSLLHQYLPRWTMGIHENRKYGKGVAGRVLNRVLPGNELHALQPHYMIWTHATLILCRTDQLLANDREINQTTAIARQQLHKYATVLQPVLGSDPRAPMEVLLEAVFSLCSAPRLYHSTDRVHFS